MRSKINEIENKAIEKGELDLKSLQKLHKKHLSKAYDTNYVRVNPYFISIGKGFPIDAEGSWSLDIDNPSRQAVFDFATTMEALYKGDRLIDKMSGDYGQNSNFAQLINISQIEGLKRTVNDSNVMNKPKYRARVELTKNFDSGDIDKQNDLVKALVRYSSSDNAEDVFPEYFHHTENVRY